LVSDSLADALDDLFTPSLLEIVGGATWTIFCFALLAQFAYMFGQLRGRKAVWRSGKSQDCLDDPTHASFITVDATHFGLSYLDGCWKLFQRVIGDEALIDTRQRSDKALENSLQQGNNRGKFLQ